jgi:hypothetical protein
MPIKNEDLKTIGQFEHLEKLVLNNTDITGENLSSLQSLTNLKSLSLSGTKQTKNSLLSWQNYQLSSRCSFGILRLPK